MGKRSGYGDDVKSNNFLNDLCDIVEDDKSHIAWLRDGEIIVVDENLYFTCVIPHAITKEIRVNASDRKLEIKWKNKVAIFPLPVSIKYQNKITCDFNNTTGVLEIIAGTTSSSKKRIIINLSNYY